MKLNYLHESLFGLPKPHDYHSSDFEGAYWTSQDAPGPTGVKPQKSDKKKYFKKIKDPKQPESPQTTQQDDDETGIPQQPRRSGNQGTPPAKPRHRRFLGINKRLKEDVNTELGRLGHIFIGNTYISRGYPIVTDLGKNDEYVLPIDTSIVVTNIAKNNGGISVTIDDGDKKMIWRSDNVTNWTGDFVQVD